MSGLEVEDTKLVLKAMRHQGGRPGYAADLDVDTVIFCIGDQVDETFGLPVRWNEFVKSPNPMLPNRRRIL